MAVLTHTGRPAAVAAANRLVQGLSDAGIVSVLPPEDLFAIEPRLAGAVAPLTKPVGPDDGIELMVVLGGDGTILRGAEWVLEAAIPLLGVNLGHVGFLAEAESSEIDSIVAHVVERSYTVEERFTIEVILRDCGSTEVGLDLLRHQRGLDREGIAGTDARGAGGDRRPAAVALGLRRHAGLHADRFHRLRLLRRRAGGLAGRGRHAGVAAQRPCPVRPPLVLSPTSTVIVEVVDVSQTHGVVWCDGRRSVELRTGMEIEVTRGAHRLRLARLSEAPFTDRLVHKFGLRVEGWRGASDPVLRDAR